VTFAAFVEHLSSRPGGSEAGGVDQLLAFDDLALTFACSRGSPQALKTFDSEYGPDFEMLAKKLRLDDTRRADARQMLWQRLFVGDGGPPKILEYSGRGKLRHWFCVLVSRFLLNEIRRTTRERLVFDSSHAELQVAAQVDPELQLLQHTYRQQFRAAFQHALIQLRPDQRNALRCHYVHAMTVDQMAAVFGVHRSTAARRIVQAREDLLRGTCEQLRRALGVDTQELQSVIGRVWDQSACSVARLLAVDATTGSEWRNGDA
jgi:RNA polymerase sigma-70 factor (ECF subfamily)